MKFSGLLIPLITTAVAQNACSNIVQLVLAPLRPLPDVQSFCGSRYPLSAITSTTTSVIRTTLTPNAIISTTTSTVTTTTTSTISPTPNTVTAPYTVSSTSTVTVTPPPVTVTTVQTTVSTSTVTQTTTGTIQSARRRIKRATTSSTILSTTRSTSVATTSSKPAAVNAGQAAVATLLAQAAGVASTFCSCAQRAPSTVTSTKYTTSTTTLSSSTVTISTTITTTKTTTITASALTVTKSSTTTQTATVTITAAPSTATATSTVYTATSTVTVCGNLGKPCPNGCGCLMDAANLQSRCYRDSVNDGANDCGYILLKGGYDLCPPFFAGSVCVYYVDGIGGVPATCAYECPV